MKSQKWLMAKNGQIKLGEVTADSFEIDETTNEKVEMAFSTREAVTLSNSIIGVSILAMPYCMKNCGLLLGAVMLTTSCLLTRFTCHILLKSSIMARRKTYEFLAFHTFGPVGKLAVELNIIGFMLGILISFFVVIGDLGPPIVANALAIENSQTLRSLLLIVLGFFVALPVAMLKDVQSLSNISALSIVFYFVLCVKTVIEAAPVLISWNFMDQVKFWDPSGILQSLPIFALALSCQTQIFEIYDSLPDPNLKHMNFVIKLAVYLCTGLYLIVGVFGYLANFNHDFTGNILLSFSPGFFTEVMKMLFVLSVAMSFPLVILPCRTSIHSLLFKKSNSPFEVGTNFIPETRFRIITFTIVVSTLIIGLLCPNKIVLGFVGSTIGVLTCVIFPALIFIQLMNKNTFEKWGARLVLVTGVLLLTSCTWVNLNSTENVSGIGKQLVRDQVHVVAIEQRILVPKSEIPLLAVSGKPTSPNVKKKPLDNEPDVLARAFGLPEQIIPVKKPNISSGVPQIKEDQKEQSSPVNLPTKVEEKGKKHEEPKRNVVPKVVEDDNLKRQEPPVPQEPEENGKELESKPIDNGKVAEVKDDKKDSELNLEALNKEDKELDERNGRLSDAVGQNIPEQKENKGMDKHEEMLRKLEEQQRQLIQGQIQFLKELKEHEKRHEGKDENKVDQEVKDGKKVDQEVKDGNKVDQELKGGKKVDQEVKDRNKVDQEVKGGNKIDQEMKDGNKVDQPNENVAGNKVDNPHPQVEGRVVQVQVTLGPPKLRVTNENPEAYLPEKSPKIENAVGNTKDGLVAVKQPKNSFADGKRMEKAVKETVQKQAAPAQNLGKDDVSELAKSSLKLSKDILDPKPDAVQRVAPNVVHKSNADANEQAVPQKKAVGEIGADSAGRADEQVIPAKVQVDEPSQRIVQSNKAVPQDFEGRGVERDLKKVNREVLQLNVLPVQSVKSV